MQRAILAAWQTVPHWQAAWGEICTVQALWVAVSKQRGQWCETECRNVRHPFASLWRQTPHQPHSLLSRSDQEAFRRAVHTLVRRGLLQAVDTDGGPKKLWAGRHIQYVRLPPVSELSVGLQ